MKTYGKYGWIQVEKGPNDHRGVALRVLTPHPTALGGFTRDVVEFWGSYDAYQRGATGLNELTKSDIEDQGFVVCDSMESAMGLAKEET